MSADQTASQRTSSSGSNRVDSSGPTGDGAAFHDAPGLSLSRFLDVAGLTQLQQRFARMTGLRISIRDPDGQILTTAGDSPTDQPPATTDLQAEPTVAIEVEGRRLGSISIEAGMQASGVAATADVEAAAEFLDLWANGIALLCHQGFELSRRVEEFSALYKLSTLLSAKRDLQELLDTATRSAAEVMKVKAASIRLLDDEGRELIPRAVFNLSPQYLSKGPVAVAKSAPGADAMYIPCARFPVVSSIDRIEADAGLPVVTSTQAASGSCSACAMSSRATSCGSPCSSASTRTSEGPAGESITTWPATCLLASVTHRFPGPTTASTGGIV